MTCIVAVKDSSDVLWLGGDALVTTDGFMNDVDKKVFNVRNMLVAGAGYLQDISAVRFHFVPPNHPKKLDDYEYMSTVFRDELESLLLDKGTLEDEDLTGKASDFGTEFLFGYNGNFYHITNPKLVCKVVEPFYAIGQCEAAFGALYALQNTRKNIVNKMLIALKSAEKYRTAVRGPFTIINSEGFFETYE